MERKYLKFLENWINDINRKPLLLLGARQVGKTYLVKNIFAEKHFKDRCLRIDCSDDVDFVNYVEMNPNLNKVIEYIQLHYDFPLDNKHLLFIDEAQECLPIIRMMKQFCETRKDIPLIVSGSLVRIKINRITHKRGGFADKSFLFPVGKINQLIIYPLTFDEFLFNYKRNLFDYLLNHFKSKEDIDNEIHKELLDIFNEYLFIGGMPEVVKTFIDNKDNINRFEIVSKCLNDLYTDYLSDMELYQASRESIIKSRLIYKNIYSQLNKKNKNFKFSNLDENFKNRDLIAPIEWLSIANIVIKSYLLKERVSLPLVETNSSLFRLYLSDMGLFTFQSGINAREFALKKDNSFTGIYYENYIATELTARGINLFYWKGKRNSEFEFIFDLNGVVVPIYSKKGKGRLYSLEEFRNHNKKGLVIKLSSNKYGYSKENDILTIPFYYFSFYLNNNF